MADSMDCGVILDCDATTLSARLQSMPKTSEQLTRLLVTYRRFSNYTTDGRLVSGEEFLAIVGEIFGRDLALWCNDPVSEESPIITFISTYPHFMWSAAATTLVDEWFGPEGWMCIAPYLSKYSEIWHRRGEEHIERVLDRIEPAMADPEVAIKILGARHDVEFSSWHYRVFPRVPTHVWLKHVERKYHLLSRLVWKLPSSLTILALEHPEWIRQLEGSIDITWYREAIQLQYYRHQYRFLAVRCSRVVRLPRHEWFDDSLESMSERVGVLRTIATPDSARTIFHLADDVLKELTADPTYPRDRSENQNLEDLILFRNVFAPTSLTKSAAI